jgi:hypothetical protein
MAAWYDSIIDFGTNLVSNAATQAVDNAGRAAMGGAGLLLVKNAYDRLGDVGQQAYTAVDPIAESALTQSAFKPFTVTTGMGGTLGVDESGNVDIGLGDQEEALSGQLLGVAGQRFSGGPYGSEVLGEGGRDAIAFGRAMLGQEPELAGGVADASRALLARGQEGLGQTPFGLSGQQQAAQRAFGLGQEFMGQAGMPMGAREQDVYNRIRATQLGEEERQRLALEERLFAQGRGGVQTAMYGGTPEQLTMAKAQESAQNQAALMAITQAQQEQRQAADIGATYGQLGSNIATQRQALEAAQQLMAQQALQGGSAIASQEQALRNAQQMAALQGLQTGQGLLSTRMGLQEAQQRMGLGALTGAYIPQAQSLNALQQGLAAAGLQQRGQLYGAGLFGEAKMTGLEALLGASLGQANLIGQAGTGLLSGAIG